MSDYRPVVGVVGHGYLVPKSFGDLPVTGTPPTYLHGLAAAGARPVILPPDSAVDLFDLVDALVLTGGGDVDPLRYGGTPGSGSDVDRGRDEAEIALARDAAAARVPVLGICRGHQVLAVAAGGGLGGVPDHLRPEHGHRVMTAPGSLVHDLLGPSSHTSALHHQAVVDPGPLWRPTAWTEDGTVEAIEPVDPGWPALGVQWHPELAWHERFTDTTGPALFGWLVNAARTRGLHLPHEGTPSCASTSRSAVPSARA